MTPADALALFQSALAVSLPTFAWVALGMVLRLTGVLSRQLSDRISLLAFRFGLPVMLFAGAAQVDYTSLGNARYLLVGVLTTLLVFASSWLYTRWRRHARQVQGIFVQSAFRSNLAIVGLALAFSAYGEVGTSLAALPVALMTVLYNILAVWVLNATLGTSTSMLGVVTGILRNPLIMGIGAGVLLSVSPLPVPGVLTPVGVGLSKFFMPLVLVCIGAAMDFSRLYRAGALAWEAVLWRLCVAPLAGVLLALLMGVRGEPLGVLFLLIATPVAASAHIMVVAARGDGVLSANIVVLTTALSLVSITTGFFLLSAFSLVGELR